MILFISKSLKIVRVKLAVSLKIVRVGLAISLKTVRVELAIKHLRLTGTKHNSLILG